VHDVNKTGKGKLLRRRKALRTGATKTIPWAEARACLSAL